MKKVKLDLENIQVESFPTSSEAERVGTVNAYQEPEHDSNLATGYGPCCNSFNWGSCVPSQCIACVPPTAP